MADNKMKSTHYWSTFLPRLGEKAVNEAISAVYFENEPLNRWLRAHMTGTPERHGLMADTVFEAAFPSKAGSKTLKQLAQYKLLHPRTVEIVGKNLERPYAHQQRAFELLGDRSRRNSVLISSGTGSGKTECFMVPLLDDLVRECEAEEREKGLRALFIYPLNALIESQQERLSNWLRPLKGRVRFVRYNGDLPEKGKSGAGQGHPEEIFDRADMRKSVPDLMLSNPSMLERMLLRRKDEPIIKATRRSKSFRWVIIDEAHTYVGARAAELALLLRRIMNALGANPGDVHFVLTSATVDAKDEEAKARLKSFLRDISGTDPEKVHLVLGEVNLPPLLPETGLTTERRAEDILLENVDWTNDALRDRLFRSATAVKLRNAFIAKRHMRLSELSALLGGMETKDVLAWLDLLSAVGASEAGGAFLPLRMHQMLNSTGPLMACPDPACPAKDPELQDEAWRFGQIWLDGRQTCVCGAPLMPLAACRCCNGVGLLADLVGAADGTESIEPPINLDDAQKRWMTEETSGHTDVALEVSEEEEDEEVQEDEAVQSVSRTPCIVTNESSIEAWSAEVRRRNAAEDDVEVEPLEVRYRLPEASDSGKERLTCPDCGDSAPIERWFVRRVSHRYAQFLLPFVLQYGGEKRQGMPMMGNRMISFTDSRDGTATSGALLEREGEHAFVERVAVELLRKNEKTELDVKQLELLNQLGVEVTDEMLRKLSATKKTTLLKHVLEAVHRRLEEPENPFAQLKTGFRTLNVQTEEASRILVLREFAFRPVNGASLENCGLVSLDYPRLSALGAEDVPPDWPKAFGLEGWKVFLKHFVDFFCRINHILVLPPNWEKAGGDRNIWAKAVFSPRNKEAKAGRARRVWPMVKRPNAASSQRIIRYLAALLGVDLMRASKPKLEVIDQLSVAAFDALRKCKILEADAGEEGVFRVNLLESASLRLNKQAYAFKGINSLVGEIIGPEDKAVSPLWPDVVGAEKVDVPQPVPAEMWEEGMSPAVREAVEERVSSDPAYRNHLEKGRWNRLGTYALMEYGYFAAVEHSAQVDSIVRTRYVERFKKGLVNILSCTTTMEMGVDIGGFNTVFMNGVPPHPANYLQRAGRAGRRGETRMNALTLCRPRTRDQEVFNRPDWALTERQTAVGVTLQSAVLVERHVNAQIIGTWCLSTGQDPEELTVGDWIGRGGGAVPASTEFETWLDELEGADLESLRRSIATIVRYSVLEGLPLAEHFERCRNRLKRFTQMWIDSNTRFVELLKAYHGKDEAATESIRKQKKVFCEERLYDMFTQENVFPSSVRIVNVISFKNTPRYYDEMDEAEKKKKGISMNLPSRPGHYAVHEYAPGASVLIDGKVYESAGIMLSWHSPTAQEKVREILQFKKLGHCRSCGCDFMVGYEHQHVDCPACGSADVAIAQSLSPKGFTTDEKARAHNDFGHRFTYAKREPTVTIEDVWTSLGNESGMLFKSSPNALVLSRNDGRWGNGFAVCLHCGWSRPEPKEDDEDFEKSIASHYPIRNAFEEHRMKEEGLCRGAKADQPFLVQRHVVLAASSRTDALALRFEGVGRIFKDRRDARAIEILRGAMTGIAVALRHAVAQHFFVDDAEIDFSVGPLRDGAVEISLFDTGMCGYTSSVSGMLPKLLREARAVLANCPNGCADACSACIMSYDAEWHAKHLNRHDALRVLTETRLAALEVEEELRGLAGDNTTYFNRDLHEYLLSMARIGRLEQVALFCHGLPSPDVPVHLTDVVRLANRLAHAEAKVEVALVAVGFSWRDLPPEQAAQLEYLTEDVDFGDLDAETIRVPSETVVAEARTKDAQRAYAVRDAEELADWRFPALNVPVYEGELNDLAVRLLAAPFDAMKPEAAEAVLGSAVIRDFGAAALRTDNVGRVVLEAAAAALGRRNVSELAGGAEVAEVTYSDRYVERLIDPVLVLSLFAGVASGFRLSADVRFAMTMSEKANEGRPCRGPVRLSSLWTDYAARDRVLSRFQEWMKTGELWGGCPRARLLVKTMPKKDVPHYRRLTVTFSDGRRLQIGFDRGVSFLEPMTSRPLNLQQVEQSAKLLRLYLDPSFATVNGMLTFNPDEAVMSVWLEEN